MEYGLVESLVKPWWFDEGLRDIFLIDLEMRTSFRAQAVLVLPVEDHLLFVEGIGHI